MINISKTSKKDGKLLGQILGKGRAYKNLPETRQAVSQTSVKAVLLLNMSKFKIISQAYSLQAGGQKQNRTFPGWLFFWFFFWWLVSPLVDTPPFRGLPIG